MAKKTKKMAILDQDNDLTLNYGFNFDEFEFNASDILQFISLHKKELLPGFKKAINYYKNEKKEIEKEKQVTWRKDLRIKVPYTKKIIDSIEGYSMSNDVKINTNDDDELFEIVMEFSDYNQLPERIKDISTSVSIYGRSFAYLYQNKDGDTKVTDLTPENTFLVFSSDVEKKVLFGVTYYSNGNSFQVYTRDAIYYYSKRSGSTSKYDVEVEEHFYQDVPLIQFSNDKFKQSYTQNLYDLIDLYDFIISGSGNEILNNADSILKILGFDIPDVLNPDDDEEDWVYVDKVEVISNMIKTGVIYAPPATKDKYDDNITIEPANVDYISRDSSTDSNINFLNLIESKIYEMANIVDSTSNLSNSSGSALEQRMQPMKQMAGKRYSSMNSSLRHMIKLFLNIKLIEGKNLEPDSWKNIKFEFTTTTVDDTAGKVKMFKELGGKVSNKTALEILPFISNPDSELKLIEDEENKARSEIEKRLGK